MYDSTSWTLGPPVVKGLHLYRTSWKVAKTIHLSYDHWYCCLKYEVFSLVLMSEMVKVTKSSVLGQVFVWSFLFVLVRTNHVCKMWSPVSETFRVYQQSGGILITLSKKRLHRMKYGNCEKFRNINSLRKKLAAKFSGTKLLSCSRKYGAWSTFWVC
jgi:hypothetical protein